MKTKAEVKELKKILKKICNDNGILESNVFVHPKFGYIETIDFNQKDADYCKTEYNGIIYKVKYQDGCFNPFITNYEN